MKNFYVYIYLNPLKSGNFQYNSSIGIQTFEFEPFYIGKGSGNRVKTSLCSNDNKLKQKIIDKVLLKTKHLPFSLIIQNNMSEDKAFELEKELIKVIGKKIDKLGPLTNIADGGEGSSGVKISEETRKKYKKSNRSKEICGKKVYQYDLDGNFIKEYLSGGQVQEINSKFKQTEISKVCRVGGTRYNFQWYYEFKGSKIDSVVVNNRKSMFKSVIQMDLEGNKIEIFDSISIAAKKLGYSNSKISECCKGKLSTYKKFKWKYVNESN